MSKKFLMIVALLLIVPTLLAACGGDLSEDDAEKGLKAALSGDREEAEKYICDEELEEMDSSATIPEGTEYDLECKKDGDNMTCTMSVEGTEMGSFTANVEDGKLCGIANE